MENFNTLLTPHQQLETSTVTKEPCNYNQVPRTFRSQDHLTAKETSDKYIEESVLDYQKVHELRQELAQRQTLQDSLDPNQKKFVIDEDKIIEEYLKPFNDKFSSNEELTGKVQQALKSRLSIDDETYKDKYSPVSIFKKPEAVSQNQSVTDNATPEQTVNSEPDTSSEDSEMDPDEALAKVIAKRKERENNNPDNDENNPNTDEDEDEQKTQELAVWMPEFSPEAQTELNEARTKFAKATAKMRFKNFMLGRGSKTSDQARLEYEAIQDKIIEEAKLNDDQKIKFLAEDREKFYEELVQEKEALQPKNKTLRKLYNWLGTPNPEKNKNSEKLKRVAAVGALALVASGAISLALPAIFGGVVAGGISLAATRGGTEALLSRKLNAQKDAISQNPINNSTSGDLNKTRFTEDIHQESKEIAKSNRKKTAISFLGGLLVGSIFAFGVDHIAHALTDNSHVVTGAGGNHAKNVANVAGKTRDALSSSHDIPTINTNGSQYPWDYFAKTFGAEKATPMIEQLAQKLRDSGWQVNSFEHGINSLVSPNGKVYNTTQGIVSALLQ